MKISSSFARSSLHVSTCQIWGAKKRFELAYEIVNENTSMMRKMTWKSARDRYQSLQTALDRYDKNKNMYGVGRDAGEMDELLLSMRDARDDLLERGTAKKKVRKEQDEEKEGIGNDLMHSATPRSRPKC